MKKSKWLIALVFLCLIMAHKYKSDQDMFFDRAGMDTTINPADDFFHYVNGNWIKNAKIPDDEMGWGSFFTLNHEKLNKLRSIIDEISSKANYPQGSLKQKVVDLYASGMDTIAIENAGYEPLKPMLEKIDAVKNVEELLQII